MTNIHLNLSKHDMDVFNHIVSAHGMSPVQMIEQFIHDTVRGVESTKDFLPVLANGYVKEVARHNPDGSFKFPIFFLEQWIYGKSLRNTTADDFGTYLSYCETMREKPESTQQAFDSMKTTLHKFGENLDLWQSDHGTHDADPDGSGQEDDETGTPGREEQTLNWMISTACNSRKPDAEPDGSDQAEPGEGDPEQE